MKPLDQLFTDIACEHLGIDTLDTRQRDSLDFHDVSVFGVKAALIAAYQAGERAAAAPPARPASDLPIVIVTVRSGCVDAVEATTPLRVILEDWDCEARLTGIKPYRTELPPMGRLSRKRTAQCLRQLNPPTSKEA
jgi:hypothetical protein